MNEDATWTAAKYFGWAVIIAVAAAFPDWVVIAVGVVIVGGFVWLYRLHMRIIDDFYENADRDSR